MYWSEMRISKVYRRGGIHKAIMIIIKCTDEIFKAGLYHSKQRELWIKSISDHTYLVAGYKLDPNDAGEILAYGKIQDMEELERQIHNLHLDNEIMDMVMHYHKKTEELAVIITRQSIFVISGSYGVKLMKKANS